MNKIFKVIFNKSLGRMVIVSENAKSAGKTTVSGQALSVDAVEKRNSMVFALKPLLLCMSLCIGTQAWADICMLTPGFPDSLGGNNGFLPETLACGYMNSANGINSTSVGVRNSALGNYSNALGYNNTASGAYSSAVGTLNKSIGIGSSAIGSGLKQHGIETYNFGPKTLSFDNFTITTNLPDNEPTFTNDSNFTPDIITSINGVTNLSDAAKQAFVSYVKRSSSDDKINEATGIASSALGVVNNAVGLGSSAVGFNNNATGDASAAYGASTSALAQYSSVFGSYSQATAEKATAVGYNSVADRANTISVGKSGAEKQITNVAAGSQSTDAVNKKQMDDSVGVVDSRITTEVGTLDGKITANSNAITGLDGRVTTNEGDIANLQQGQGTLNQLAVQYDTATQDVITLKGTTGTKITNLKNGDISTVSSKDAVTGGQLFTTNTAISTLDGRVTTEVGTLNTRIGTEVTTLDGRITSEVGTLDGKITTNSTAISGLDGRVTTEVGTLNTRIGTEVTTLDGRITSEVGTLDGKITTNSTAISGLDGRVTTNEGDIANLKSGQGTLNQLAVQYDTTTQDVITLKGTSGTKITNLQNGDISTVNSKDAVTGGQLYTTNTAISTLDGRVTTEVGTLNTRIGTEVGTLNTRMTSEVDTLDGKITTNSNAINTLGGRVTTNEGDIANLKSGQGTLNQLAVQYDTTTQDVITLKGTSGTKITNLQNGDISTVNSKDAVTGGQLYTTNTAISTLDGRVTTEVGTLNTRIGTEVGTLNTRMTSEVDTLDGKITINSNAINTLGGRVTTNEGDIANLKSGQGTLNQLAVQYDTTTQDIITLKGTSGTKITNLQNGDISTVNSKDAVTGGQLYTTNTAISTLDGRVTTEIGTLNTRIGTEVTTLDGRITSEIGTLDGKITTNSTAISGLDGRVTTNEGDIANLQQGQGTLNQLAVQYDSATQDVITLKGANGTTLTNLKAGDISTANSKDAVTGGQLYTTNQNVTMLSTQAMADSQQITSILGGGASYSRGVFTLPTFSIQGKSYSNIGDTFGAVNTEISSLKTSVTNLKAYVDQQNSGSEGNLKNYIDQQDSKNLTDAKNYTDQQASNTLNNANKYTDQQASTTLDSANQYSDQQAATALKNANAYTDHKVTGINTGTGNTKGTGLNSTAIGPNTVVSGNNSTAVGVGNNVSGNNSGAFGDPNIVTANGSYVVGNDNTVSGDNTFVLGNNVNTSAKNSVVLGNDSTSTRDNTVSVGSTGNERQITNVADATEKTDAVNLRQMQAANTETLKSSKEYTETRVSTLESSFSDFSYQTDRRFKEVDKRFDRQGAMSAAMMNMATSTAGLKGLNRVGVAAGFQGDEKAVAIGYQRIVSENVSLSVGGAFTDEDGSGGAGVGFSW